LCAYFLDLAGARVPVLSVILLWGYFRPMKLLYRVKSIWGITSALAKSLRDIWNVLVVLLMVWLVFGVFGVTLYGGQFGFCEHKMSFRVNRDSCLESNRSWVEFKHNFNNITEAIPTLFVISSFDGWGEIMQISWNSQTADIGPDPFNSAAATYVFYILFVFIGSMFFLNFFTGILYMNFRANQLQLQKNALTQP
jgi:hypothetical protein